MSYLQTNPLCPKHYGLSMYYINYDLFTYVINTDQCHRQHGIYLQPKEKLRAASDMKLSTTIIIIFAILRSSV